MYFQPWRLNPSTNLSNRIYLYYQSELLSHSSIDGLNTLSKSPLILSTIVFLLSDTCAENTMFAIIPDCDNTLQYQNPTNEMCCLWLQSTNKYITNSYPTIVLIRDFSDIISRSRFTKSAALHKACLTREFREQFTLRVYHHHNKTISIRAIKLVQVSFVRNVLGENVLDKKKQNILLTEN